MESGDKRIFIDTKYKLLYNTEAKIGITQSDLYQMLAYAVRLNIDHGVLLYPGTVNGSSVAHTVVIPDELAGGRSVSVHIHQVLIHDEDVLSCRIDISRSVDEIFAPARKRLIDAMYDVLQHLG